MSSRIIKEGQKKRKTGSGETEEFKRKIKALEIQNTRLSSLINVSREIMREMRLEPLFRLIMKKVTQVMDAERSSLFLVDRKTNELYALIAQRAHNHTMRFPMGKGIAGQVAVTGEIINLSDAYNDARFNRDFDKKTGFKTKAVLCMPIRNSRKEILGVMQVLNKKGGMNIFTGDDQNLLAAFSSIVAISLENSFAYETINRTMTAFEKFVPRRYLESIIKGGLDSLRAGNAERVNVSILFADIRNFTSISERMEASETLIFLNDYLVRMNSVIKKNGGFIDKFIGDAIMAVFDSENSDAVLNTAEGMMKELARFNRERSRDKKSPVKIGIGIHFGPVVLGTIGSDDRMDSTIIGDSVNLAARMEGLTKIYGCPVMITDEVVSSISATDQKWIREVDTVKVKGKDTPVRVYDFYSADPAHIRRRKFDATETLRQGIDHYKRKEWDVAAKFFKEGKKRVPSDRVFGLYLERCKQYGSGSVELPENWDGSFTALDK